MRQRSGADACDLAIAESEGEAKDQGFVDVISWTWDADDDQPPA
jgi:hypothetical protein